uniref:Eukaryotic translation initiation factor 4E transporter n=1 Tax=Timema monikensis TaxID=170555 RepID=A0A7R9EAB0_9NEOP|nr:unnamed protein product [Timema monikensis]
MDIPKNVEVQSSKDCNQTDLPMRKYSRDDLISIRRRPQCKEWPGSLDPIYNNVRGLWDPERWHLDSKQSGTPTEEEGLKPGGMELPKRRLGDPRERVRKEQDGIVLSPQRRSFNSGCYVPANQPTSKCPGSPREGTVHREVPVRRIGSGRILSRDTWDYRMDPEQPDFVPQRSTLQGRDRDKEGGMFNRRFPVDHDKEKDRKGRYSDRRRTSSDYREEEPEWFSGGPTSQHDTIELHGFDDNIQEHGGYETTTKMSPVPDKSKGKEEWGSGTPQQTLEPCQSGKNHGTTSVQDSHISDVECPNLVHNKIKEKDQSNTLGDLHNTSSEFNLEDFLQIDNIPDILNEGSVGESVMASRFSQWFQRDSPVGQQKSSSRRSSLQEDILNNIINVKELSDTSIFIPSLSESDTYFTPISPAASTTSLSLPQSSCLKSNGNFKVNPSLLLEMLHRGSDISELSASAINPSIKDLEAAGKVHSVEELEAKIRKSSHTGNHTPADKRNEEDMVAFKKLMLSKSHESGGNNVTSIGNNRILNSGVEQDTERGPGFSTFNSHCGRGQSTPTAQQMQIPQDLVMKLLQVQQQQQQQEMLNKLVTGSPVSQGLVSGLNGQFQVPPPPGPPPSLSPLPPELQLMVNNAQPSRELLQRPEALAIIQGLRHGQITSQHIVQQLQNPAMQHRHREVLVNILKFQMRLQRTAVVTGLSPQPLSPHHNVQPPSDLHHIMLQQQQQQTQTPQQQLRIPSPLNGAYCQQPPTISPNISSTGNLNTLSVQHTGLPHRVPSPRELIVHTQNIMQSALIKKKLEEQRENYRKRQEMQQSLSPNLTTGSLVGVSNNVSTGTETSPAKHLSPTPLTFTPTSVLRKMTAEKEADSLFPNKITGTSSNEQIKLQQQQAAIALQQSHIGSSVSASQFRLQTHTVPSQWNMTKQQGRAIVKGNCNLPYSSNEYQNQKHLQQQIHKQQHHNHNHTHLVQQNQQLMHQPSRKIAINNAGYSCLPSRAKLDLVPASTHNLSSLGNLGSMQQTQLNTLLVMHQSRLCQNTNQRAPHQLETSPECNRDDLFSKCRTFLASSTHPPPIPKSLVSLTPIPQLHQAHAAGIHSMNPHQHLPGNTSPTSDQLARWFSPELLAQARAGNLPDMPPVPSSSNMLSLEELERLQQASAAVHN